MCACACVCVRARVCVKLRQSRYRPGGTTAHAAPVTRMNRVVVTYMLYMVECHNNGECELEGTGKDLMMTQARQFLGIFKE